MPYMLVLFFTVSLVCIVAPPTMLVRAQTFNIDSDYTFENDLSEKIVVIADNIVIDGNGYTLQGWSAEIGITLSGRSNVTIKNLAITGWGVGIFLSSSANNSIVGNSLSTSVDTDIVLRDSSHNSIADNTLTTSKKGIDIKVSSHNNSIEGNTLTNIERGIALKDSANNSIAGNTFINSTEEGIWLESSSNNIVGNTFTNSYFGIYQYSSTNNSIVGNIFTNSTNYGIRLSSSSNNSIVGNTLTNSTNCGINLVSSSNYNSLVGNTLTNSTNYGIRLSGSYNNRIMGNTLTNSTNYGVWLYASNNVVYHNNFIDNGVPAYDYSPENNAWHHPDLLEGNYWSDYEGVDDGSGTGKHAIADDGIGDTAIPHPAIDFDYYPFVRENGWILPPYLSSPTFAYEEGTTGHFLSWTMRHPHPKTYAIYNNSVLMDSDSWTNGTITWNIDGLAAGTYNFTLVVYDKFDNFVSGTVWVTVYHNTPTGTSVEVTDPLTDVTVNFDEVTSSGTTTVIPSLTGPAPPADFEVAGQYYDITTTASYTGPITIAIPYDETQITGAEADLTLRHWNSMSAEWEDVTTGVDTAANIIYGEVTRLSIFAVMESEEAPPSPAVLFPDALRILPLAVLIGALVLLRRRRKHPPVT